MDAKQKRHLLSSARALVSALESDNDREIENQLAALIQIRNNKLLLDIEQLTRDLHTAINNINVDLPTANLMQVTIPSTRERLSYIANLTEQAAHQTLEAVETAALANQTLSQSAQTLNQHWQSALSNEQVLPTNPTLTQAITNYLSASIQHIETIRNNLSEISLAQSYQDITGQVIRQLTDLIEEVETNLVQQPNTVSQQQATTSTKPIDPLKAEGPQMNATGKPNIMTAQDDVDDLLSSLGL